MDGADAILLNFLKISIKFRAIKTLHIETVFGVSSFFYAESDSEPIPVEESIVLKVD